MTNTFSYDTITAENIVSRGNLPNEFLHIPNHEMKIREYERDRKRLIGWELHCSTLTEYYKNKWIPRGLRSHLRPTLFSEKKEFCERFESILNKCSLDLILLTIEELQTSIGKLALQIKTTEDQLTSTTPEEEITKTKERINKQLQEYQKYAEQGKRQKFVRGAEDYKLERVYRWKGNQQQQYYRGYRHPHYSGSSASDSDRSGHHEPRFLGNAPRRGKSRRGGPGGAGGNQEGRIQTRSQTH
ncbi:uncharacterized protein LOC122924765 [Bufo gargarizans]|uniref:uncharacterized protein LOC122924764 n=1 Tax=Bufo gargarizans TaxID=30331 RepID=UPI001CF3E921|nr:uncharacterized protein LOC122924764 [Bufo gargarizans]XP_044132112.1 uncharacterized protein LOC122924764 [Bufo gargarizans]XP_044132113.1 uncharacterized protein LOC122924765 [Bufo gargarizans]XP_044132114.1 uncharacterized protein LOC122924765 [Bufo gargarizans]